MNEKVAMLAKPNESDALSQFVERFLANRPSIEVAVPFDSPVAFVESMAGLVIYRDGPFQVQLFIAAPNSEVPEHRHPNVDSYEVFLGGDLDFRKSGRSVVHPRLLKIKHADKSVAIYHYVSVAADEPHSAKIGPRGGAFLSVQHWRRAIRPTSVGNDWIGSTMGEHHSSQIGDTAR